jgi:DNA-binding LacI/PurR family transcriptional regulator
LTTIRQPADQIGRLAVDIIQKRIDHGDVGNRTILKPILVVRDSCGARRAHNVVSSTSGARRTPAA